MATSTAKVATAASTMNASASKAYRPVTIHSVGYRFHTSMYFHWATPTAPANCWRHPSPTRRALTYLVAPLPAVVTGAGSGIGKAVALGMLKADLAVPGTDIEVADGDHKGFSLRAAGERFVHALQPQGPAGPEPGPGAPWRRPSAGSST